MKLLLQFKESSKIRDVADFNELHNVIETTFKLEPSSYFIQKFDKDFNDYVDIEDNCVDDKDKIRVMLSEHPKIAFQIDNSLNFSSELINLEEVQEQDVVILPPHTKQWPHEIKLPFEKFSGPLKEILILEKKLSWDNSREIVGHLANYAYAYKPYPCKSERLEICEALVREYPYLRNDIGAGVGGWELKLLNKLKKIRQTDSSLEVELNRLNSKIIAQKVPKNININPKRGELNWAPNHIVGETQESANLHKKFMCEESKKSSNEQDRNKVGILMSLTYSFRREKINQKVRVGDLKDEYPFLFQKDHQFEEFSRLTAVSIKDVFFKEATEQGNSLYELFAKKKKSDREATLFQNFKEECKDMDVLRQLELKAAFGFFILPYLLRESHDCIFKLIPDDNDTPEIASSDLKIYGRGTLNQGIYNVVAESTLLAQSNSYLEAVCLLISFYFTLNIAYPPESVNTLKFLQFSVLKIKGGSIPAKVKTIMSKMSK